ncbi:MAG: hypothetical protein HC875_28775, partial [Anaerolineales bacterium]|nr:hypothetical protein [Anaerolineales bacterium]
RHEILRRIYVAIRDPNWGTILPKLSNIQMDIQPDSFRISYDVENKQGDIDFFWRGAISGDTAGTISFSMDGEARSTFRRNRIGFCVLHPMECAGAPAQIEHVDGSVEENSFPRYIGQQLVIDGIVKPVHPFEEMQALTHQIVPDLWAEVRFSGEIFELEDQRNWTDASYKTYGTPLRLPFPVEITAGTKISQSVTLTLQGQLPADSSDADASGLTFSIESSPGRPFPRLGLGVASHNQPLSRKELARLKALNLTHLRIGLRLSEPDNEAQLRQAAADAAALGVALEVALFLSDAAEAELKYLADMLERVKPPVWAWLIFHDKEKSTSEKWVNLARERLEHYDPAAKIGAGTNAFFAELNRSRPPVQALDLVCYSINPQVHAFDNLSLVETLAAQAPTVKSARQFCGDRLLAVTPVTLRMRFNPNATGPEPEPEPGQLPSQVDERQMSLFGAGWTAGSLKYLAESGVDSLTYYETTGWRGVMETEAGSPVPDKFPSLPGVVFPLYHVLADVGEFAAGEVVPTRSSQPLQVDGLALRHEGRLRVVLANLSPEPKQVLVQNLGRQVRVRTMDETNAAEAMQNPEAFRAQAGELAQTSGGSLALRLRPFAIARLEEVP